MELLANYWNGDFNVELYDDGTLVRTTDVENPQVVYPTSIDVKITDYCDLGCAYCHESSTTKGKHGDLYKLLDTLQYLPAGVELAIGGGNPLSHPHLFDFLVELKHKGIYANITVNQGHIQQYWDLLENLIVNDLVKGVGISITSNNFKYVAKLKELTNNIVYHVIAGVNSVEIMNKLIELGKCKVLILGYKQFGFGINYFSPEVEASLKQWYMFLPKYLGKCTMSFDNLAIEQLNVKRLFTSQGWNKFYMGDDFTFTMYIDAVKQQYAPTSRSRERTSFDDFTLIEYFNSHKNEVPCIL